MIYAESSVCTEDGVVGMFVPRSISADSVASKGSSSAVAGRGGICAVKLQVRVSNDGLTRPFPPVRRVSLLCQLIAKPTRLENATMP